MYFDRFDICEAYWCFYAEWGHDDYTWKICGQLERLQFKPSPDLSSDTLEENGKEIYNQLVEKYRK